MIKILVVHSVYVIRRGIAAIINDNFDAELDFAYNGLEAMELASKYQYDLVIFDLTTYLHNYSGLLTTLKTVCCKVLVYTNASETIFGERCLKMGANGYIMQSNTEGNLNTAIKTILNGGIYMSHELVDMIVERSCGNMQGNPIDSLSDKEFEICTYLSFGYSKGKISALLQEDKVTVSNRVSRVLKKMKVSNLFDFFSLLESLGLQVNNIGKGHRFYI